MEIINETPLFTMEEGKESEDLIKEQNQIITDTVLKEYPKMFEEYLLEDGSNVALLYYGAGGIPQELEDLLPEYKFIALSRHGLTMFNCSYFTLEWERTKKAIEYLIELSCGEEIKDLIISHWHAFPRIRKTKGLLQLKKNIKSVLITGVNLLYGVKDFYYNCLKTSELNKY
ncbi:MAG: hypothetical protein ACOX0R_00320 [Candidatus Dojkabacteria bacterium]|jgi:hypothetical protein